MPDTNIENIKQYLGMLKPEEIPSFLADIPLPLIEDNWGGFSAEEQTAIFLGLSYQHKIDLVGELSPAEQEQILEMLSVEHTKLLFAGMAPDDVVDIIQKVSPEIRKEVWQNLSEEARKEALFLLKFDEDDAAGLMTPRYLAVRTGITVRQAFTFIRKNSENMETVYYIYVVDHLKRLIGVVSLRQLLSSADEEHIESIMQEKVISVREDTDQEEAAKILETRDLLALPVTDDYNRLLGIITVDDVIDVIRQEQTEDMYKMGAMDGKIDRYMDTSIFGLVKKRIPWLIVLLILGTITTNVLHHYESLVIGAAFLFIFMPVITQTGGNTGNQSTTLMIRGLATGELFFRDIGKVVLKELAVGLLLGIGTGIIIALRSAFLPPGITIMQAIAVGSALSLVVIFSNLIGIVAPLVIHRLGFDPTVMSGPLMATVIDVAGLTIYFETAKLILKI